ncbi:Ig-like domain-containing protein, partial [Salmonella enterica subsp. enterica serovar Cerro]|nr:Ig-like domain-containing protein [Salmonella enterica subsp. enterica serovar Cerro]
PDSALADGSYTFTVTVTDVAGNQQTSAPLKVTIDGTLTTPVIVMFIKKEAVDIYIPHPRYDSHQFNDVLNVKSELIAEDIILEYL